MNLNHLRDEVFNLAREKGWYEGRDEVPDAIWIGAKLALIHSEVSEALEEVRTLNCGHALWEIYYGPNDKPEGLPVELADIIIRTLDLCGALGIDIERAVHEKHAYNATRPHRHGGKAL